MKNEETPRTITLDGNSYEVAMFSHAVQQLVAIYSRFTLEMNDHQLEIMKTQAALEKVNNQLLEQVKKELIDLTKTPGNSD